MEYEHGTHDEWECPGESACNGQRANTVGRQDEHRRRMLANEHRGDVVDDSGVPVEPRRFRSIATSRNHTSGCAVDPCTCGRQHVRRQPVWRAAHAFMERLGRALGRPWRS